MVLWEIIDQRSLLTIKDVINKALIIILIICIDGIIRLLDTLLFPSGNFTVEIIIVLGDICAIFLMGHLILMVIVERIYNSYIEIKKLRITSRKIF